MLMMMRADENYTAVEGCSAEELLACFNADDYDACIAACSDEPTNPEDEDEVKAGTLTVSLGNALADGTQIPNAGIVSFGTVNFKASSEDVNLKSVTIKKQGLVKTMANTKVWFEENGNRVSAKVSFNSDGEAIISFAPAYTVKANKTAKFDLYVDLTNAGVAAGTDLSFASTDVDSSAESNRGSFTTPTLRTANYTVADVQIFDTAVTPNPATCLLTADGTTPLASWDWLQSSCPVATHIYTAWSSTPGAAVKSTATKNGRQLAEFRIENASATEDVLFRSIQLRQDGTADLENISDVVLERNSEVVSTKYTIDGKYLTILLDNDKIEKGNNAVYTLRAKVNTVEANDNYEFYLKNAEDLNVVEATTEFRANLSTANYGFNTYGQNNTKIYTVEGGDVTFARDESLDLDQTVAAGSEVVLMQWTITTKESVTFENPVLTINSMSATTTLSDLFTTLYLKIGNSVFTYTAWAEVAASPLNFDGTAVVNGKANVKVYGTLKNTSNGKSIKLDSMDLQTFKVAGNNGAVYYSNEVTVSDDASIWTIAWNSITVENTTLSLTRTDGLWATANVPTGDGSTIYKAKVTSQSTKWAKVTSVKFNITAANTTLDQATTLTVYVDGTAVATKNLPVVTANTNVTFNGLNFTVDKDTVAEIEVKANIKEGTAGSIKLEKTTAWDGISYVDLANNRTLGADTIDWAKLTVTATAWTISVDADAVDATLLVKWATDQKVATLRIGSDEGKVRLYNLELTMSDVNVSNVRLANASGEVVATATSFASNKATFTNISNTEFVEKDGTISYDVLVDVNSNVTPAALTVQVTAAQLRNNNGWNATTTIGTVDTSNSHYVAEWLVKVEQVAVSNPNIKNSALKFTVKAEWTDIVVDYASLLAGLDLTQVWYENWTTDLSMADAVIYKNSVNAGNVVNADVTITKWSTTTFIVAFPTAVVAAATVDRTLSLNDFDTDIVANVANYANVWTFPITANK